MDPVESDPDTWQCCNCDSLDEEDKVERLVWEDKVTISCPKCGHPMGWHCCGPEERAL